MRKLIGRIATLGLVGMIGCGNNSLVGDGKNGGGEVTFGDVATREECSQQNGVWGEWGYLPRLGCNERTDDFGKTCYDSRECEGVCFYVGDEGFGGHYGICSEFRVEFGCFSEMHEGEPLGVCYD